MGFPIAVCIVAGLAAGVVVGGANHHTTIAVLCGLLAGAAVGAVW